MELLILLWKMLENIYLLSGFMDVSLQDDCDWKSSILSYGLLHVKCSSFTVQFSHAVHVY